MPKPRFRLRSLLAIPVVVAVAMSVWIIYAPAVPIDGDEDVALEVEVRDAASGDPIRNALIQISDPYYYWNREKTSQATTRSDGRARIVHRFKVVGYRRAYRFTGEVRYAERWLEVYVPGHERLLAPLTRFTGERADIEHSAPIRVALREGESPGDLLNDIAGHYVCRWGQGFANLDILADGRFSRTISGCFTFDGAYGFARLVHGVLRLEPIAYDQLGGNAYALAPLYPIKWSTWRFLLSNEQILEFCNAINQGPQPRKQITADFYHREADREKKLEGLPALPGEWNRYLLKKPISATITQVRADRSATIDRGSKDGIQKGMHFKAHGGKGDRHPYREVEVASVDVQSSVIRQVSPECAWRQQLSYFGDGPLISGEKVTSRFRKEGDEMLAGSGTANR